MSHHYCFVLFFGVKNPPSLFVVFLLSDMVSAYCLKEKRNGRNAGYVLGKKQKDMFGTKSHFWLILFTPISNAFQSSCLVFPEHHLVLFFRALSIRSLHSLFRLRLASWIPRWLILPRRCDSG